MAAECDLLRHQLDALRQQPAQGQAAAGPSGDLAVSDLQQQLQDSEAQRQVAEARTAELEGQVEAMVEQLGSSADQSVVALEKEVGLAVHHWAVTATSAGHDVYATLQRSRDFHHKRVPLIHYSWELPSDLRVVVLERVAGAAL